MGHSQVGHWARVSRQGSRAHPLSEQHVSWMIIIFCFFQEACWQRNFQSTNEIRLSQVGLKSGSAQHLRLHFSCGWLDSKAAFKALEVPTDLCFEAIKVPSSAGELRFPRVPSRPRIHQRERAPSVALHCLKPTHHFQVFHSRFQSEPLRQGGRRGFRSSQVHLHGRAAASGSEDQKQQHNTRSHKGSWVEIPNPRLS